MKQFVSFFSVEFIARTLRFSIVGIVGTVIYAGLAFGFLAMGVTLLISHSIAYIISLLASYLGQKIFTFEIRGQHKRNFSRFVLATIGLAVVQFLLVAVLEVLKVDPKVIIIVSTLYYPPASFIVHNLWTFKESKEAILTEKPEL